MKNVLLQSLKSNPLAWVLAGILVFSIFSHYQTGKELTQVCETVASLRDGYFDLETLERSDTTGIDLDAIMVDVERVQMLLNADTAEGRAYRWWRDNSIYIVDVCTERLADDPYDE